MIQLSRALVEMRRSNAELRGIGPEGRNISWCLSTDMGKERETWPVSVLEVQRVRSDNQASVPWTAIETITFMGDAGEAGIECADLIVRALNGRLHVSDKELCVIGSHMFDGGGPIAGGLGGKQEVVLRWKGRASWMAKV